VHDVVWIIHSEDDVVDDMVCTSIQFEFRLCTILISN
jgi:hypothetical protein